MSTVRALVIEAGKEPIVTEVDTELTTFQQLVGGNVEALRLHYPDAVMWFNEDGKTLGLEANGSATLIAMMQRSGIANDDFIVGTAVITGKDRDDYTTDVHPVYVRRYATNE